MNREGGGDMSQQKRFVLPVAQGAKCMECASVVFEIGALLKHVYENNHLWWKSGEVVFRLDLSQIYVRIDTSHIMKVILDEDLEDGI